MSLALEVGGEPVVLRAERALAVPRLAAVIVADVHFGKPDSFRRQGVPVPAGTTARDLATLEQLLRAHEARHLVFLGDLLHSRHAQGAAELAGFPAWRRRHAQVRMTLVRGNHDSHAGDPPADWGIEAVDEPWPLGPFACCHHPQVVQGGYALAGHLHPAVVVGRGLQRLRLPCFHFGPQSGVLPAFGSFTGLHTVQAAPGDRVAVIAEGVVRLLPTR